MMEDEKQLNESDSDLSREENPMLKHLTEAFESMNKKIEKELQPLIEETARLDAQNRDFLEKIELQFQAHVAALKADQPVREEVKKPKRQNDMQKREDAVVNFDKKAVLDSIRKTQRYGAERFWQEKPFEWPLMSELEVKND